MGRFGKTAFLVLQFLVGRSPTIPYGSEGSRRLGNPSRIPPSLTCSMRLESRVVQRGTGTAPTSHRAKSRRGKRTRSSAVVFPCAR